VSLSLEKGSNRLQVQIVDNQGQSQTLLGHVENYEANLVSMDDHGSLVGKVKCVGKDEMSARLCKTAIIDLKSGVNGAEAMMVIRHSPAQLMVEPNPNPLATSANLGRLAFALNTVAQSTSVNPNQKLVSFNTTEVIHGTTAVNLIIKTTNRQPIVLSGNLISADASSGVAAGHLSKNNSSKLLMSDDGEEMNTGNQHLILGAQLNKLANADAFSLLFEVKNQAGAAPLTLRTSVKPQVDRFDIPAGM